MVYGFVKQSQGHIKIYSEVGAGTTVKIYLPQADHAAQAIEAKLEEPIPGGTESILVVEDDELVRETTKRQLEFLGYRVVLAANAKQALKSLNDEKIELLLTDVVMPGSMNGRQLADLATRQFPGLKVVFMSGYTENAIIHHGRCLLYTSPSPRDS